MLITANEEMDQSLAIVQAIQAEDAAIPEYDQLYLDKQEEFKQDEVDQAEEAANEAEAEPTSQEEANTDEPMETIDGKQTTVATEAIRNDHETVFALEMEYNSVIGKVAGFVGTGIVDVSKFGWEVLKDLAGFLKEAGIQYGPGILARIKTSVAMVASRSLKLSLKLASASAQAYDRKKNSYEKSLKRLQRIKQTLDIMKNQETELTAKDPFNDANLFSLFYVNGKVSVLDSMKSVRLLMDVMVEDIDKGLDYDVRTIEQLIENTRRGVRFNPLSYLSLKNIRSGFKKTTIEGYAINPELMDSFVLATTLPKNTLLIFGLPKESLVTEAAKTDDMTDIAKAYHSSFMVLGLNPTLPKSIPAVNYVDKTDLVTLTAALEQLCVDAMAHTEVYQNTVKRAERLKLNYQHYFAWLTANEDQKSLKESFAELIYLKQAFATKVYFPAMLDIHDYVALYIASVLKYVEDNIRVIKPVGGVEDSAV